jgi:hypothetical protein
MPLEQLYYMDNNIRPKSVPKGVIVVCFHLVLMMLIKFDPISKTM